MNHIFDISNDQLFQFVASFHFMTECLEATSSTVEGVCRTLEEAVSHLHTMFPQSEPYHACAFISTKHQCFMDDLSLIQDTFSSLPGIDIMHCNLATYCDDLDDDEPFKIRLLIGNTKDRDPQLVSTLIERALQSDEDAVLRLGCDPQYYSDIISFGLPSAPFDIERHIIRLFRESAGSIPHLFALAAAFFHGIIVPKDLRMAHILTDCALKARALYTDDQLQERYSWIDPEAVQYYFLSDAPSDRHYVLDWIRRQSHSDTIFRAQCAMLMEYYDQV